MKPKEIDMHLTASERSLMEILWDAQRPLGRPEILEKAGKYPGGPAFSVNTFHVLINSLLEKDLIIAIGGSGVGRGHARRYAPTVTRNEYYALQIVSAKTYTSRDIPELFQALLKYSQMDDPQPVLAELEEMIAKTRKEYT